MGCDIHMYAEVKKNGKWEKVGMVFDNYYYDPKSKSTIDKDGYHWNAKKTDEPFQGRCYDLFAILANVRNGHGFAGCDTGDGFKPISETKGLPNDLSLKVKEAADTWNGDGHSHSWFTVKELINYDWMNQKTKKRGWVSPEQFETYKLKGRPDSWCGGVGGRQVEHVSPQEMERKLKEGFFKDNPMLKAFNQSYYCLIEWGVSYYESCKYFVDNTIPALKDLGTPENVRIVFWFDN